MYRERNVLEFFATQNCETEFGRNAGAKLDEIRNDESWRLEYMTYEMALMDARYDGRSEGIAIGERQGIAIGERRGEERGRTAGIAIGIAEGARETALANARNFKRLGVSEEIIAEATGLSPNEVAAL